MAANLWVKVYPLRVNEMDVGCVSVPVMFAGPVEYDGTALVARVGPGEPTIDLPERECSNQDRSEFEVVAVLEESSVPIGTLSCCPCCQPELFAA